MVAYAKFSLLIHEILTNISLIEIIRHVIELKSYRWKKTASVSKRVVMFVISQHEVSITTMSCAVSKRHHQISTHQEATHIKKKHKR
jgi:hypothetical protein